MRPGLQNILGLVMVCKAKPYFGDTISESWSGKLKQGCETRTEDSLSHSHSSEGR